MATPRRFFAPEAAEAGEFRLDAAESHRLRRVLRLAEGAEVEVFDGRGSAFAARFCGLTDGGRCRLARGRALPSKEPGARLTVGIAAPKGDGLTAIVRQLAEVGAAVVVPLETGRSEGSRAPSRLRRWRAAALSGSRQSGRAVVPEITSPRAFRSWIEDRHPPDRWIASAQRSAAAPPRRPPPDGAAGPPRVVVAIGPEGGFSAVELDAAAARGFLRLDLGERMLRTGTAAVVAAARLLSGFPANPAAR